MERINAGTCNTSIVFSKLIPYLHAHKVKLK